MSLILAIESDSAQANAVRHVVRDLVGADLILVDCTDAATAALARAVPDLILLPAFFSPSDEAALTARLRAFRDARDVQTLTIPLLAAPGRKHRKEGGRGLFGIFGRRRRDSDEPVRCDPRVFADQVTEYLERAREAAAERRRRKATAFRSAHGIPVAKPAAVSAPIEETAPAAVAPPVAPAAEPGWTPVAPPAAAMPEAEPAPAGPALLEPEAVPVMPVGVASEIPVAAAPPAGQPEAPGVLLTDLNVWTGFCDSFGERRAAVDDDGTEVELLRLFPEYNEFEAAISRRTRQLSGFDHLWVARTLRLDHDARTGSLILASERLPGMRLSELLFVAGERPLIPDLPAALFVMHRLLSAAGALHGATGATHAAIAPERIVITPRAEVVVAEPALAATIEALWVASRGLRQQLGASATRTDVRREGTRIDIAHIALVGMSMMLGRPIEADWRAGRLDPVLQEASEVAAIRAGGAFGSALRVWFERALADDATRSFRNFRQAATALQRLPKRSGVAVSRRALRAFLRDLAPEGLGGRGDSALEVNRVRHARARQIAARTPPPARLVVPSHELEDRSVIVEPPGTHAAAPAAPEIEQQALDVTTAVRPELATAPSATVPEEASAPTALAGLQPVEAPQPAGISGDAGMVIEEPRRVEAAREPADLGRETTPGVSEAPTEEQPARPAAKPSRAAFPALDVLGAFFRSIQPEPATPATAPQPLERPAEEASEASGALVAEETEAATDRAGPVPAPPVESAARSVGEGRAVAEVHEAAAAVPIERAATFTEDLDADLDRYVEAIERSFAKEHPGTELREGETSELIEESAAPPEGIERVPPQRVEAHEVESVEPGFAKEPAGGVAGAEAVLSVEEFAVPAESVTPLEEPPESLQPVSANQRPVSEPSLVPEAELPAEEAPAPAERVEAVSEQAAEPIASEFVEERAAGTLPAAEEVAEGAALQPPLPDEWRITEPSETAGAQPVEEAASDLLEDLPHVLSSEPPAVEELKQHAPEAAASEPHEDWFVPRRDMVGEPDVQQTTAPPVASSDSMAPAAEADEAPRVVTRTATAVSHGYEPALHPPPAPPRVPGDPRPEAPVAPALGQEPRRAPTPIVREPLPRATASGPARWVRPVVIATLVAAAAIAAVVLGVPAWSSFFAPKPPGTVIVQSTPTGSDVFVNGKREGATPLTLRLPPGTHTLELRRGRASRQITVRVASGQEVSQHVNWSRGTGGLEITSDPSGATVLVDGRRRGVTPLTLTDLPAGSHNIVLQAQSGVVQRTVEVQPGSTLPVHESIFSGWVAVFAPIELQIYEGGRRIGTTEEERLMMAPGRHQLEVVNTSLGYRAKHTVDVSPGEMVSLNVQPPKGTVRITAPAGAEVFIDGERVGEAPLADLRVAIGARDILVKHPQLGEQRVMATVTLTAPAEVKVDLGKGPGRP